MRAWHSRSVEETRRLGRELAAELAPDGVLLLSGELGTGKTVLVQGLAEGLGIDPLQVLSPSYTLIRDHRQGESQLFHVDLYRLEPGDEEALGLEELLCGPGVKAVEWAERLTIPVGEALRLEIRRLPGTSERELLERPPATETARRDGE